MASLNVVYLVGNLTRDVELRYTPSGRPVAQFRLAINRRFRDRDGNQKEDTVFLDVETWGRQAETVKEYLAKGWTAFVEGRLRVDEWTGRDGQKRSKLMVVAWRVQSLGPAGRVDTPASRYQESGGERTKAARDEPAEESSGQQESGGGKTGAASDEPAEESSGQEDLPVDEEPPF